MKVKSKVWLEKDGKLIFGTGKSALLKAIRETGSINKAAAKTNMSYRSAWSKICSAEKRLGLPLLIKNTGGKNGGGTMLTKYAEKLLEKFDRLEEEIRVFSDKRYKKIFISFFIVIMFSTAVLAADAKPEKTKRAEITVAAAADLYNAFTEIGRMFENESGNKVIFSFGSTGNLATQIEGGAPFDIFAAANVSYIERLKEKGLIENDSIELYAQGRIVLAVNKNVGIKVENLKDLLNPGIKKVSIANPEHAPYGQAAKEALESAGLWESVSPKFVYGENVRQTLIYIQKGEAEAGIVALSVASVSEISYTLIDDQIHKPLNQKLGIITSTKNEKISKEFITYVNTKGRPIMKKYGFLLPGEFNE